MKVSQINLMLLKKLFNKKLCIQCELSHSIQNCPALNYKCFKCNKTGHTSCFCKSSFVTNKHYKQIKCAKSSTPAQKRIENLNKLNLSIDQQVVDLRKEIVEIYDDIWKVEDALSNNKSNEDDLLVESCECINVINDNDTSKLKSIDSTNDSAIVKLQVEDRGLKIEVNTGASLMTHTNI